MSKSEQEAKETRCNLLVKNNQTQNNSEELKSHQGEEKVKEDKLQENMAVGINVSSEMVCGTRTLPPENTMLKNVVVGSGMKSSTSKNSSNGGKEQDIDNTSNMNTASSGKIKMMNDSPPPSPAFSHTDAPTHIKASRLYLEECQQDPPSGTEPRKKPKRPAPPKKEGQQAGRWTAEEHELFLEGLKMHGREWKKVAEKITTRTSAQIRSHAQKYFSKLAKESGQLHPYDGYTNDPHHLISHSSTENLGDMSRAVSAGSHLSVSVLQKIERIVKDPVQVENEVETTLKSLRERYLQLQLRLQAKEQRRLLNRDVTSNQEQSNVASVAPRLSISAPTSIGSTAIMIKESPSFHSSPASLSNDTDVYPIHNTIRSTGPATAALELQQRNEASARNEEKRESSPQCKAAFSNSKFNVSLASASPNREFGSEELIALQVLGGALSESTSNNRQNESSCDVKISKIGFGQSPDTPVHKRKASDITNNDFK